MQSSKQMIPGLGNSALSQSATELKLTQTSSSTNSFKVVSLAKKTLGHSTIDIFGGLSSACSKFLNYSNPVKTARSGREGNVHVDITKQLLGADLLSKGMA